MPPTASAGRPSSAPAGPCPPSPAWWSRARRKGPPADLLARMQRFYDGAVAAGHEGLMAKALDAPYAPGRRGANWLKVKAQATLDLAIIGADWGTGRRHKWLSNYHLACRDGATGDFLSVGETFKGLTDAEFAALTERLLALQTGPARGLRLRPAPGGGGGDLQRRAALHPPPLRGGPALRPHHRHPGR